MRSADAHVHGWIDEQGIMQCLKEVDHLPKQQKG
jgi:hypothetical protein